MSSLLAFTKPGAVPREATWDNAPTSSTRDCGASERSEGTPRRGSRTCAAATHSINSASLRLTASTSPCARARVSGAALGGVTGPEQHHRARGQLRERARAAGPEFKGHQLPLQGRDAAPGVGIHGSLHPYHGLPADAALEHHVQGMTPRGRAQQLVRGGIDSPARQHLRAQLRVQAHIVQLVPGAAPAQQVALAEGDAQRFAPLVRRHQ